MCLIPTEHATRSFQSVVAAKPLPLNQITATEHLLLFGMRAIAVGRGGCPMLQSLFTRHFGQHGLEVFGALFVLIGAIAATRERELALGMPGCSILTVDERFILAAITAARDEAANDHQHGFTAHERGNCHPATSSALAVIARALQPLANA